MKGTGEQQLPARRHGGRPPERRRGTAQRGSSAMPREASAAAATRGMPAEYVTGAACNSAMSPHYVHENRSTTSGAVCCR